MIDDLKDIFSEEGLHRVDQGWSVKEAVNLCVNRMMETLEPLGFNRSNDGRLESCHEFGSKVGIKVYKQTKSHLWFHIGGNQTAKIEKERAIKLLVLGLGIQGDNP
jgi:hypothetical protein